MTRHLRWSWLLLLVTGVGCSSCFDRAQRSAEKPAAVVEKQQVQPFAGAPAQQVRPAAKAGSWYPADRDELAQLVDGLLAAAQPRPVNGPVVALVSPHAGYAFSGKAAAAGFKLLQGQAVRRVVVLGVSHRVPFDGASILDVTHYETPLGKIPVDRSAVARLRRCRAVQTVHSAHQEEHSLELQLPLLQRVLPRFSLVPLLIGRLQDEDYQELAAALAEVVDQHTVVVASTDFTHRGPSYSFEVAPGPGSIQERLQRLDQGAVELILQRKSKQLLSYAEKTGATICGVRPVALLLELLSRFQGIKGQVEDHYTSGDVSGDWTNTVTYLSIAFAGSFPAKSKLELARSAGEEVFPLSNQDKQLLLRLARGSLQAAVKAGAFVPQVLEKLELPASLQRKAGAFVTLKCRLGADGTCLSLGDELRGCIGTIPPRDSLHETVARRAASAALEDTRFPNRVSPPELDKITLEVSVLTPPRTVAGPDAIEIGRHGIILSKDGRSATFLPQVAPEQGWDRQNTLRHLALKAGLPPDGWRQGAALQVYEAIVFSEDELAQLSDQD